MKYTAAILAAAASLSQVSANWGSFYGAQPYSCPGNSDNHCTPDQSTGWDWSGLSPGKSCDHYDGFDFSGWTCQDNFSKRDSALAARGFSGRVIEGECGSDVTTAPSFGCGADSDVDQFSISSFDISVEFDCRMEFHYGMPDGSVCKQTSDCSSGGSTVYNSQCGGAKTVHFVYPPQPDKPKSTCGVGVHNVHFDCGHHQPHSVPPCSSETSSSSAYYQFTSSSVYAATTSSVYETPTSSSSVLATSTSSVYQSPSSSAVYQSPSSSAVYESSSSSAVYVSSSTSVYETSASTTASEETSSTIVGTSTSVYVVGSSSSVYVVGTSSAEVGTSSSVYGSPSSSAVYESASSSAVYSSPTSAAVTTSSAQGQSTTSIPVASVTTYQTTSTIYTTSVHTVTSCASDVVSCPAGGYTSVVTVTVPVSTTVCPVTEAVTTSYVAAVTSSAAAPSSSGYSSSSSSPGCPSVVPKCLNTWIWDLNCKDNSDASCYCPSEKIVKEIYTCLYAHGETDDIVSEAVHYFMGLCAPYASSNPAVVTGAATVTTCLTVTATSAAAVSATYTTVSVEATVTVPCVEGSTTVAGSSTVSVITTQATVPYVSVPAAPATTTAAGAGPSTLATRPVGTGGLVPSHTGTTPVTGAAAHLGAGLSLGLAVLAAVFAL